MDTATPNFIRIGHPAYNGANHAQWTNSASKAIEILRERGVKRDEARAAVSRTVRGNRGSSGATMYGGSYGNDVIELAVFDLRELA